MGINTYRMMLICISPRVWFERLHMYCMLVILPCAEQASGQTHGLCCFGPHNSNSCASAYTMAVLQAVLHPAPLFNRKFSHGCTVPSLLHSSKSLQMVTRGMMQRKVQIALGSGQPCVLERCGPWFRYGSPAPLQSGSPSDLL